MFVQMDPQRSIRVSAAMVLLNLSLIASVAAEGWLPTFEPILGTSKGGTRVRVHSTAGNPWSLSDHYLQLGLNGATLAADHVGALNDSVVESQFVMPTIPSAFGTKGVVELSFSGSGNPYVDIGSFVFYDGDRMKPEALAGVGQDGLLALNPTVFPESLDWRLIKPSCGFRDGTVAPALLALPQTKNGSAELYLQCDEGASSVSLNDQEYFPISPPGQNQARLAIETPPTEAALPLGLGYKENEEEIPRRRLTSGPVCTTTDTAMGLTITVTYLQPSYDPVNATVSNGVTYNAYGGPTSYLIRIIISTPGHYTVTSMYPACVGGSVARSFNVSGAPSPLYSYMSTTFPVGGLPPGLPVPFYIQSVDQAGIVPSAQILGPCPFAVTLHQADPFSGLSYSVPFTVSSQAGGVWKITAVPTRFLPVTGTILLENVMITDGSISFTLTALTLAQATSIFVFKPDLNELLSVGPTLFSIDSQDILPKYNLTHEISLKVIGPNSTIILQVLCNLERTSTGCYYPLVLTQVGSYIIRAMIDGGTVLIDNVVLNVIPGMVSGKNSNFSLVGISTTNVTKKIAGDTITASISMQDEYGNQGNTSFIFNGRNVSIMVALRNKRKGVFYMDVNPGLGTTSASIVVTTAGLYVASAYIGSSGNSLIGSNIYTFYVQPYTTISSGFTGNMMVGKMIAGQPTPIWVVLLDTYGNTIDGSKLSKSIPLIIQWDNLSFNATNNGRIFEFLPGINQTIASTNISILAFYNATQVATYNATCLPGPPDIIYANITVSSPQYSVGENGTLLLSLMDSWGNLVDPSMNNLPFSGARLLRVQDVNGALYVGGCSLNYIHPNGTTTNPYLFTFTLPTIAASYFASIPLIGKIIESAPIVRVVASNPIARMCTISGVIGIEPIPNSMYSIYVTPRDMHGNVWFGNFSTIPMTIVGPTGILVPKSDITFATHPIMSSIVTFKTPNITGLCNIYIEGQDPDPTSTKLSFRIIAGDFYQVQVEEVRQGVVGEFSSFFLVAQDAQGYARDQSSIPNDRFSLTLCDYNSGVCGQATINDRHISGGRYLVTWSAPLPGNYSVNLFTPNGGPSPLNTLTVIATPLKNQIVYYPRCNNAPPSLATCPHFFNVIAGERASFKLAAYDEPLGGPYTTITSGGNLPAVFMTGGNIISLVDESDGTYFLTYMATMSTTAIITITNGVPNNISLLVIPGRSSSLKSYFQLSYNLQATYVAGSIISGGFYAQDSFGNQQNYNYYDSKEDKFQIMAFNSYGEKIRGANTFYNSSKGMFGSVIFLNYAGEYTLIATLHDSIISILAPNNSTLVSTHFVVTSGPPDLLAVSYVPSSMQYYALPGMNETTSMYAINDRFGNHVPRSSLSCSSFILDKWNTPWQTGACTLFDDHITFKWFNVFHSDDIQFQVVVKLGNDGFATTNPIKIATLEPWPPLCSITTSNSLTSIMGTKTTIDFFCRDKNNNLCHGDRFGQFSVVIACLGGSPYDTPMYANMGKATNITNDGHYVAYFVLNLKGDFTAVLRFGDIQGIMIGQPIIISSLPANTSVALSFLSFIDPAKKILTNRAPVQIIAGTLNFMKVVGVDVNGNLQHNSMCYNTSVPSITILTNDLGFDGAGAGVSPFLVNPIATIDTTNPNCVYLFNFTLTAVAKITSTTSTPATYTIRVLWMSTDNSTYRDIAGSPFAFQVDPAPLSVQSSLISLLSRSTSIKGLSSTFLLQTKDIYGNNPLYTQSLIVFAIVAPAGTYTPPVRRLLYNTNPKRSNHVFHNYKIGYNSIMINGVNKQLSLLSPTILNNGDSTYTIFFSEIRIGSYDLFVFLNEELLVPNDDSIATISNYNVGPGIPDISRIRPIGIGINDATSIAVGMPMTLIISLCDTFGNPISIAHSLSLQTKYINGISNASTITISRSNIHNNILAITPSNVIGSFSISGGNIIFSCIPTTAGLMNLNLAYNDINGSSTTNSILGPFHISIIANDSVSPSTFHVFGPGVEAAVACEDNVCTMNTMYVKISDLYNNILYPDITLCQNFSIVGWNPSLIIGFVGKPIYENYCAISWKLLPSGTPPTFVSFNVSFTHFDGSIHAILADSHVTTVDGSGYKFTVPILNEVVDPDPNKCIAFGDLGGLIMAGTSGHIIVQLVDFGGVALQTSPSTTSDFVHLNIIATNHVENPPLPPTIYSTDNGDGTFSLQYDTIKTGTFTILILVGYLNRPLAGRSSGYSLKVVAAPSIIESTIVVMVSNSSTYRVGRDHVQIQVQAVDNYLNLQDYTLSQIDGFQARILQPDNSVAIVPLDRHQQISIETGNLYVYWLLNFLPLQASEKSTYSFNIVWRNDTHDIFIPTAGLVIPTIPGPLYPPNIQVLGSGSTTSIVGQLSTFSILLYDVFNNAISSVQDLALAKVSTTLSLEENSTAIQANCTISIDPSSIICQYIASIPGHYGLSVYASSAKLTTSSVTIKPGLISGPNCLALGDGVGTNDAYLFPGEPTSFDILAYDLANNTISERKTYFEVKGESVNQSQIIVPQDGYPKYISKNAFQIQYTPLKAGNYNLFVKRANVNIVGSPFQVAVQTGPISPNCILDEESLNPCVVMSIKNITLWSRDAYGNIRTNEQDIFHIHAFVDGFPHLGLVGIMTPLGAGAYGFSFPCMNDTFIQVVNDAILVYSGKIIATVGPADPKQTTLFLDDVFISAGKYGHGLVVTRDFAGHQLTSGQQSLYINYGGNNGQDNGTMLVTDNGDGTYTLTYVILTAGIYQLQGTLNEYWPFYNGLLFVTPSDPHTALVYFDPNGYVVGTSGTFEIQYFDEHQNNITNNSVLDTNTLSIFCMSWDIPSRTALYSSVNLGVQFNSTSGFFIITFQPTMAGVIFVNLKIKGLDVLDGGYPFSTNIEYLPPIASNFDVWGAGVEDGAVKGENTYFFVRARDALGTIIPSEPSEIFDVHFLPDETAQYGVSSAYLSNGVTMFTYSPIYDIYTMFVNYGGNQVCTPIVLSGKDVALEASVKDSVVLGPDTSEITTTIPLIYTVGSSKKILQFTIQPHDANGVIITTPNPSYYVPNFTVTVGNRPPISVLNQLNGWWYQFSIPLQEQVENLYVEVSGFDNNVITYVKNSGFTIQLIPDISNASNTQIVRSTLNANGITKVTAGQDIEIIVQPYDSYKNKQIYNLYLPDVFSATLYSIPFGGEIGPTSIGLKNSDFTYTMKLKPTIVGEYNIIINLNGTSKCFTYQIVVIASNLWLPSVLMVDSVDPMQIDVPTNLLILASDQYQNPITDASDIYCVFQNSFTYIKYNTFIVASNNTIGQFWVSFIPVKVGHYHIVVGDALSRNGGPTIILMETNILPGPIALDNTKTSLGTETYEAGQLESFTIIALDAKSNPNYTIPSVKISSNNGLIDALVTSPCTTNSAIETSWHDPFWCMPIAPTYTSHVTFIPITYGKVNVTIEWDANTFITYYYIAIQSSTQPLALNAKLSQNLGSVIVKFDIPTDAGYISFEGLSSTYASGWQRCNNTLDLSFMEKIGMNPNCIFQDATTMIIQLGYYANLKSMDSSNGDIVSISNGIFSKGDTSIAVTGWVPLGIIDMFPFPIAKLSGPHVTSVCDDIILDASGSTGAIGQPFYYQYSVKSTANLFKLAKLGRFLEKFPSQMMLTILAGQLDPDQTYTFSVTITNYLGMSNTAKHIVQTTCTSIPQVSIRDHAILLSVMRWDTIELEAHAHLANVNNYQLNGSCGQNEMVQNTKIKPPNPPIQAALMYEWSCRGSSILNEDMIGWNARSLNLPGNMLKSNTPYTFKVKVWPQGSPQLFATSSISVQSISSPLAVVIIGGNRFVNISEDLYVEVALYDPDDSIELGFDQPHPFEISWNCDNIELSDYFDSILYPDVPGSNKQILLIRSSWLTLGTNYKFTVTVARAPYTNPSRNAAKAFAIITPLRDVITVIATLNDEAEIRTYGVSSARMLKIMCSPGLGLYNWLVTSDGDPRSSKEMQVVKLDEHTLRINPLTLIGGTTYTFTCIATSPVGTGSGSVVFSTLQDPSGGTVDLVVDPPNSNVAENTSYALRAYGWSPGGDLLGSLKYEFRYVVMDSRGVVVKEFIIQPPSITNYVNDIYVLPGMIVFRVYIINPGPIRFMPNDAPYGAIFEFPPIMVDKSNQKRKLLALPSVITNYYNFAKKGMYYRALLSIDSYAFTTFPNPAGGCGGGNNKKVIKDMLKFIEINDYQYPMASHGNIIQSGSGPYIALLVASIYSRLIERPGNLNLDEYRISLHIFLQKLEKVAIYGLKVPTMYKNPCEAFLSAGDAFVKIVKLKCFKSSTQAQAMMDRASIIPIMLAKMIYHDVGFISPTSFELPTFTIYASSFKLPEHPRNPFGGPSYLTGKMQNLYITIAVTKGGGQEFGITLASFTKFSPLSTSGMASLNGDKKFLQLMVVFDILVIGLTTNDFQSLIITCTWTNLFPIGKEFAYKAIQIDKIGIANTSLLQNIVCMASGVSFDLVGSYSRIAIIKVKAEKDFTPFGWYDIHEKYKPPKNPKKPNGAQTPTSYRKNIVSRLFVSKSTSPLNERTFWLHFQRIFLTIILIIPYQRT